MPIQVPSENLPEFVEAHTRAVLEWDAIEQRLFLIFSALVRAASPEVTSAVFHSVVALKTRLTMIDAAVRVFLRDGDLYLEWRTLHERVSGEAKHRNRLALFASVQKLNSSNDSPHHFELSSIFDVAAAPREDYDAQQIRAWHDGFRSLAADLHGFLTRVEKALATAGASPRLSEV